MLPHDSQPWAAINPNWYKVPFEQLRAATLFDPYPSPQPLDMHRENRMRTKPCLTLDDAHKMVAACRKAGAAKKMEPTVAVVDAGGHLLYLERPDRNGPNTVEMATLKARTAALRARPSSAFAKRVAERPGFLAVPNCLGVPGGIPVVFEEECIGGVGVSGIGENDEPVAQAGADAMGSEQPKR
jgi:glc operon protein GlcG